MRQIVEKIKKTLDCNKPGTEEEKDSRGRRLKIKVQEKKLKY